MKNKKGIRMKTTSFNLKFFNVFSLSVNSYEHQEYTKKTSNVLDACHGSDKTEKRKLRVVDGIKCITAVAAFLLELVKLIISYFQCNYYGGRVELCIL